MKILISGDALWMGGAQRAISHLATLFDDHGHEVVVATYMGQSHDFFRLPPGVQRRELGLDHLHAPTPLHTVFNVLQRIRRLRSVVQEEQPDLVLSFLARVNMPLIIATAGTRSPLVISLRNYPVKESVAMRTGGKVLYRFADGVVSVSSGVDDYWAPYVPARKRYVVNNAVPAIPAEKLAQSHALPHPEGRNIVAMGRISTGKNFDLLVRAFGQVEAQYPNWYLNIIGDGNLRGQVEAQIESLGLQERVFLLGRIDNPFPTLAASDLFVVSSQFEGVPNVALEAMAVGLPVLSTDYLGNPRDIIADGKNGLIVARGDADALGSALGRLMGDDTLRASLAEGATQTAQTLTQAKFYADWLAVCEEVLASRRRG